jgi:hypothetical protein
VYELEQTVSWTTADPASSVWQTISPTSASWVKLNVGAALKWPPAAGLVIETAALRSTANAKASEAADSLPEASRAWAVSWWVPALSDATSTSKPVAEMPWSTPSRK